MTAAIRRYRDSDWAAVYDVCVETADAGRSTRGRYRTDDLVPDVFAGPYLFLEPEHAYVLDDGGRAVGYVLGTASTPDYVAAYAERWLPRLRTRYQPPSGPPVTEEEQRLDAMFHPERRLRPELAPHPAHLHINLLAGYRGAGHGRQLIGTFRSWRRWRPPGRRRAISASVIRTWTPGASTPGSASGRSRSPA